MSSPLRCLVCSVESDAHVWNLVYLQKLIEEHDLQVRNLGCCTPVDAVLAACAEFRPDLLVVSSVNGHGQHGVQVLLSALQREGVEVPVVAGGKLTTAVSDNDRTRADLLARGCTEVFTDEAALDRFREFLRHGAAAGFGSWQPRPAPLAPWDAPPAEQRVLSCTS